MSKPSVIGPKLLAKLPAAIGSCVKQASLAASPGVTAGAAAHSRPSLLRKVTSGHFSGRPISPCRLGALGRRFNDRRERAQITRVGAGGPGAGLTTECSVCGVRVVTRPECRPVGFCRPLRVAGDVARLASHRPGGRRDIRIRWLTVTIGRFGLISVTWRVRLVWR